MIPFGVHGATHKYKYTAEKEEVRTRHTDRYKHMQSAATY